MNAKNDDSTDALTPGVVATCANCGDEHPVADRLIPGEAITTVCPHCGDTRYTSTALGGQSIKPDSERISDAVRDVRGVGNQTRENIISHFSTYQEFTNATESELCSIDGVGKQTAKRILE